MFSTVLPSSKTTDAARAHFPFQISKRGSFAGKVVADIYHRCRLFLERVNQFVPAVVFLILIAGATCIGPHIAQAPALMASSLAATHCKRHASTCRCSVSDASPKLYTIPASLLIWSPCVHLRLTVLVLKWRYASGFYCSQIPVSLKSSRVYPSKISYIIITGYLASRPKAAPWSPGHLSLRDRRYILVGEFSSPEIFCRFYTLSLERVNKVP